MLAPAVAVEDEFAVKNLVAALESEVNEHAQYKAFADRADADGLPGVASLFRAAARAEEIHARNHARVIRQMGGEAQAEVHPFHVRTTLENLKLALGSERREIDRLYPTFLKEAASHLDTSAIRTYHWALEAEKTHARLYADAVALLENGVAPGWTTSAHGFYVCAVCGYTAKRREAENCPECNFSWERFEVIH
jgi:rubrerythrin